MATDKEPLSDEHEGELFYEEQVATEEEPLHYEQLATEELYDEQLATEEDTLLYDEELAAEKEVSLCGFHESLFLPLYNGATVTLQQTLAKYFEWFTSHPGTSKEALSRMLHMQQSILPQGNLLPSSYSLA